MSAAGREPVSSGRGAEVASFVQAEVQPVDLVPGCRAGTAPARTDVAAITRNQDSHPTPRLRQSSSTGQGDLALHDETRYLPAPDTSRDNRFVTSWRRWTGRRRRCARRITISPAALLWRCERRILIIVQNLPVPFDRRVWLECQALASAGYRVAVVCPKGNGDPSYQVIDGVELYKYRPYAPGRQQAQLHRRVRLLVPGHGVADGQGPRRGRFAVMQACNPPDIFWPIALALPRRWRARSSSSITTTCARSCSSPASPTGRSCPTGACGRWSAAPTGPPTT